MVNKKKCCICNKEAIWKFQSLREGSRPHYYCDEHNKKYVCGGLDE